MKFILFFEALHFIYHLLTLSKFILINSFKGCNSVLVLTVELQLSFQLYLFWSDLCFDQSSTFNSYPKHCKDG
ncbi:hypothetical protein Gasu2_17160 [Galdieria sulphuraria]|nr:hypothetical protein Gasu2_17160 [Galdieria sulphuraria]